jgi:DNA repair protein RadB
MIPLADSVRETLATPKSVLSTGLRSLDAIMNGGFPRSSLSLVYGEASTGKSTLLLHCMIENLMDNEKALFIDSDHSFSLARLLQMTQSHAEGIAERIMLFSPISFREQTALIENLENYLTSHIQLVVIDSITSLYSASLESSNVFTQNRQLGRQLAYLSELAPKRELSIIVTGQVHARPMSNDRAQLVSNRLLTYWPSVVLRLALMGRGGLRMATLEKYFNSQDLPRQCLFKIVEEGLIESESEKPLEEGVSTGKWS